MAHTGTPAPAVSAASIKKWFDVEMTRLATLHNTGQITFEKRTECVNELWENYCGYMVANGYPNPNGEEVSEPLPRYIVACYVGNGYRLFDTETNKPVTDGWWGGKELRPYYTSHTACAQIARRMSEQYAAQNG